MGAILGTDVILQFLKDDSYQEFVCATECSIEITTELKDVRGPNSGRWKKKRGKSNEAKVSLSGLIVLGDIRPTTFWLVDNQINWYDIPFRMVFTDPETMLVKIAAGNAIIERSQLTSSSSSFANSSFDFVVNGELGITDAATICEATIGEINVGPGEPEFPGSVAIVTYNGVTNAARLEYSVDGGAREVLFSPGSTGFIPLYDLSEGPHTITVWAVCESGVDGESNELSFNVSGGEPEACAAPGTPSMSSITTNSADASWPAASPEPLSYEWQLINNNTGSTVQSGSEFGANTNTSISGLTTGVSYTFRVRSICEEGVSMSGWQSVEFTTAGGVCNVPGTPVMSAITSTTATATWTAPSPAPADGYRWRLYQGLTIVDSGTTGSLSVNLTDLVPGSAYSFQVQAVCNDGVSESSFASVIFGTDEVENNIDWAFDEDLGNGTLAIRVNGVDEVNTPTAGTGSFTCAAGDTIQVRLTATSGNIAVDDLTASVEIENETDTGLTVVSFNTTSAHNYSITATVLS